MVCEAGTLGCTEQASFFLRLKAMLKAVQVEDTCSPICGDGLRVDRAFSATIAANKLEAAALHDMNNHT